MCGQGPSRTRRIRFAHLALFPQKKTSLRNPYRAIQGHPSYTSFAHYAIKTEERRGWVSELWDVSSLFSFSSSPTYFLLFSHLPCRLSFTLKFFRCHYSHSSLSTLSWNSHTIPAPPYPSHLVCFLSLTAENITCNIFFTSLHPFSLTMYSLLSIYILLFILRCMHHFSLPVQMFSMYTPGAQASNTFYHHQSHLGNATYMI